MPVGSADRQAVRIPDGQRGLQLEHRRIGAVLVAGDAGSRSSAIACSSASPKNSSDLGRGRHRHRMHAADPTPGSPSRADERLEAAVAHEVHIRERIGVDELRDALVAHDLGHDLVAVLARAKVDGDRGGQQVALADLQGVVEVVAAKLAVAQRAVLAGDLAEQRCACC